jgi:hypothetical protein
LTRTEAGKVKILPKNSHNESRYESPRPTDGELGQLQFWYPFFYIGLAAFVILFNTESPHYFPR